MICTCDNCHYTFTANALPLSCPDCGKETVNRRMDTRIISSPAVRVATDAEIAWYEQAQKELAAEQNADALREQMTIDEYNWSLIMQFEHQPKTKEARESTAAYLSAMRQDPDRASELYPTIRMLFSSKVTSERGDLRTAGVSEPVSKPDEGEELPAAFGPALRLLYSFKEDRHAPSFLLSPPNLGNIRRIDIEKIAREPSAAYTQFLLDWEKRLTSPN